MTNLQLLKFDTKRLGYPPQIFPKSYCFPIPHPPLDIFDKFWIYQGNDLPRAMISGASSETLPWPVRRHNWGDDPRHPPWPVILPSNLFRIEFVYSIN